MTKIRAPRVAFVNVPASDPSAKTTGVLTRDGLAFLNSLEERIADLEALVQIALRQRESEHSP